MTRNIRKTKIVATLGKDYTKEQKMSYEEMVTELAKAGANVFRINMSHVDDRETLAERVAIVRRVSEKLGLNLAVFADLQGPKLRIGDMEENTFVKAGDKVKFISNVEPFKGNTERVFMVYEDFANDVKVGQTFYINDGKLKLKVLEIKGDEVTAEVIEGGELQKSKGLNLPETIISQPALSEKDRRDAKWAIELKVDWIALSFVRDRKDIVMLKNLIREENSTIPIISKVEKPEAIDNLTEIIAESDAIMVARGDLAIETKPWNVPAFQKNIVRRCREAHIPVIVATQMLESMVESSMPTRAEVNDVANSVIDGADAVMLSGETAYGKFPIQTVQMMANIIDGAEEERIKLKIEQQTTDDKKFLPFLEKENYAANTEEGRDITQVLCYQATKTIDLLPRAKAIATLTSSGYTAYHLSPQRPNTQILVFTDNPELLTRLSLLWGVTTFRYDKEHESSRQAIKYINDVAKEAGLLEDGDRVVNLVSIPIEKELGKVNTMRISVVGEIINS